VNNRPPGFGLGIFGEFLQGAAFVALGVLLFLPWFDADSGAIPTPPGGAKLNLPEISGLDTSATAFEAFDGIDTLLICLATAGLVFAVFALVLQVAEADAGPLGIAGFAGLGCAVAAATIIVIKLIDPPGDADVQLAAIASAVAAGAAALGAVFVLISASRRGAEPDETPAAAQAGWYSDPYGGAQLRYWDGTAWTDRTQGESPSG
jgi:hypothetical protein